MFIDDPESEQNPRDPQHDGPEAEHGSRGCEEQEQSTPGSRRADGERSDPSDDQEVRTMKGLLALRNVSLFAHLTLDQLEVINQLTTEPRSGSIRPWP